MIVTAATITVQAAKKSQPAFERKESVRVMGVDPSSALLLFASSAPARGRPEWPRAGLPELPDNLALQESSTNQPFFNLLFRRGGLVHVLLHAGCVIRFQLLDLRLLVGSEQLI